MGIGFKGLTSLDSFDLDIIGIVAILGEGSILSNAEVASLSPMSFIPRLLPAPQALLRPNRPMELQTTRGFVTGALSGNTRTAINAIAAVVLKTENMEPHCIQRLEIRRKDGQVSARLLGPLGLLSLAGCAMSIGLLALAIAHHDAFAVMATLFMSLLSTVVGIGNKWRLQLPTRKRAIHNAPPGDVVVRYVNGSFVAVECTEDTARELFFAPEERAYLVSHPWKYRILSLVGTLLLIAGVITMSNSATEQQIAFAAAYILLNIGYWLVAALPQHLHWDVDCYEVVPQLLTTARDQVKTDGDQAMDLEIAKPSVRKAFVDENPSYTWVLWKSIAASGTSAWLALNNAVPSTPAWSKWTEIATAKAKLVTRRQVPGGITVLTLPDWDPVAALTEMHKG